jgi:hypothetical protein
MNFLLDFLGRLFAKQVWVYGGVERGDFGCFMNELTDDQGLSLPRNAETLLPILQDQVLPGSIVMSDCWAAYGKFFLIAISLFFLCGIANLPEGYHHLTVNHSINFVDPDTGAHTQSIESNWQKFKMENKKRYGTHRNFLQSYIDEFILRKRFKVCFF